MTSNSLILFAILSVNILSIFNRQERMEDVIELLDQSHQSEPTHRIGDVFTDKPAVTPGAVKEILDSLGVLHSDWVVSQAVLETGHFTCVGCSYDYYNIFGFRYKGQYLKFGSIEECCEYFHRWQNKWYDPERTYPDFLRCMWTHRDGRCVSYAADEEYVAKLTRIKNELGF